MAVRAKAPQSKPSTEARVVELESEIDRLTACVEALETELAEREADRNFDIATAVELLDAEQGHRQQTEAQLAEALRTLTAHSKELERQSAAAQAANDAKSLFLANMSHELRTPLHGIMSFSKFGITRHGKLPPEKTLHYFDMIHTSAGSLLELLDELLDLSKLESGKSEFHFEYTQTANLLIRLQAECEARLRERELRLETSFEGDTHCELDPERMLQVLRNLVGNAIKFSPTGGTIHVAAVPKGDRVWISVRDEGVGIPDDELDEVFDKFVQSSKTQTNAGGTGLGLAICREIIEKHHGWIWAQNHEEGGALFTFEIPVRQPVEKDAEEDHGEVRVL